MFPRVHHVEAVYVTLLFFIYFFIFIFFIVLIFLFICFYYLHFYCFLNFFKFIILYCDVFRPSQGSHDPIEKCSSDVLSPSTLLEGGCNCVLSWRFCVFYVCYTLCMRLVLLFYSFRGLSYHEL